MIIQAFEEPDEDVYTREDMSSYDFELETMEERKHRKAKEAIEKLTKKRQKDSCIDGFHFAKSATTKKTFFPPPTLPHDFQPIHKQRKSRFEKPVETPSDQSTSSFIKKGLGRHALSVQERQVLLGETPQPRSSNHDEQLDPTKKSQNDVNEANKKDETESEIQEQVERIKKFVQVLQAHSTPASTTGNTGGETTVSKPVFQPFMKNPEKQERYEKYLTLVAAGFQGTLS